MKTAVKTSVVAGAIALAATFGAPTASATTTHWLGTQADIVDGGVVQGWTVSHLSAHDGSSDAVRTDQNVAVAFAA